MDAWTRRSEALPPSSVPKRHESRPAWDPCFQSSIFAFFVSDPSYIPFPSPVDLSCIIAKYMHLHCHLPPSYTRCNLNNQRQQDSQNTQPQGDRPTLPHRPEALQKPPSVLSVGG
ncbi:hypothetical protein MN608_06333 [Microdochium nivale]|nr:hypothetical protein MN608_06333 [Microdochium nivale]